MHITRSWLLVTLLLVLLCLGLAACSGPSNPYNTPSNGTPSNSTPSSGGY
jgi:hypothetical protein